MTGVDLSHSLGSEFPLGRLLQDASSNDAAFAFIGFLLCTLKPRDPFILKMTPSFSACVGKQGSSRGLIELQGLTERGPGTRACLLSLFSS